jgi:hypothetical protein
MNEEKKYPEGRFKSMWMLIGIAIFSAIGIPLRFALDIPMLIGAGPLVGAIFGMLVGERVETKHREAGHLRPLNDKEVRNKKILIIVIFFTGLLSFFVLIMSQ